MTSLIISIVTVVFVVATLIIGTVWIESKRADKAVREVKRPARVGEYIKLTADGLCKYVVIENSKVGGKKDA